MDNRRLVKGLTTISNIFSKGLTVIVSWAELIHVGETVDHSSLARADELTVSLNDCRDCLGWALICNKARIMKRELNSTQPPFSFFSHIPSNAKVNTRPSSVPLIGNVLLGRLACVRESRLVETCGWQSGDWNVFFRFGLIWYLVVGAIWRQLVWSRLYGEINNKWVLTVTQAKSWCRIGDPLPTHTILTELPISILEKL